jgi:hypothetical protein
LRHAAHVSMVSADNKDYYCGVTIGDALAAADALTALSASHAYLQECIKGQATAIEALLASHEALKQECAINDVLRPASDTALVNICKALDVPLDWHAEPFPAEDAVLAKIAALSASHAEQKALADVYGDAVAEWRPIVERAKELEAELQEARAIIQEWEKLEDARKAAAFAEPEPR